MTRRPSLSPWPLSTSPFSFSSSLVLCLVDVRTSLPLSVERACNHYGMSSVLSWSTTFPFGPRLELRPAGVQYVRLGFSSAGSEPQRGRAAETRESSRLAVRPAPASERADPRNLAAAGRERGNG